MHPVAAFLSKHGIRLNRDLGQHFLVDENVLHTIVDCAGLTEDDHVVEIGPGIGVLTRELLKIANKVTAIELDARMIPLLQEFIETRNEQRVTSSKLEIIQGNALQTSLPNGSYKVVANIPYHITSPLLRHAFLESRPPESLTLLIQREVAEKICNTKDAGMLTILVSLFGVPTLIGRVPPGAFLPPPKVESAILHIESRKAPIADPETIEEIFTLTKAAFGQRRKMLRNTIGAFSHGTERLEAASIDPKRRPQTLSIEEWVALARTKGKT